MRTLQVELDAETVGDLEVERSLLGFPNRAAYVRWIVERRGAIGSDDGAAGHATALVEAYRERIAELEAELAARDDESDEPTASGPSPTDSPDGMLVESAAHSRVETDDAFTAESGNASAVDGDHPADAVADRDQAGVRAAPAGASDDGSGRRRANTDGGWTGVATDDAPGGSGSPSGTDSPENSRPRSSTNAGPDPGSDPVESPDSPSDDGFELASPPEPIEDDEADIDAANLAPERVERVPDDPVAEDAGVLGAVEVDRLDELSRRAVAKTRERLNRDVETGLEYASATTIADEESDVRPGEDVVDLESLDLPGRSDDLVERRLTVVGRAVAICRDEGRIRKSDAVEALYEDHPAGYETTDAWWRCVKEGLRQAGPVEGGDGARVWRYTG